VERTSELGEGGFSSFFESFIFVTSLEVLDYSDFELVQFLLKKENEGNEAVHWFILPH
jgi:hypothetical protein